MEKQLTKEQGALLLQFARATLVHRLSGGHCPAPPDEVEFLDPRAVFVTLKIAGKLRGCIGNLSPVGPLWEGVHDNALNAALHDHRFDCLTAVELDGVTIEISVLTQPKPLPHKGGTDLLKKLRPGTDGVILKMKGRSATFLPQVWEQLSTSELFLEHLSVKAGLPKGSWKAEDVVIETYQVECFSEGEL
ncbi:MAG: AmmeMemoRadiSam system protein A [Desulforhopalus sp.]|jgi:AmmeMemoRadiSam system protein A